jgi:hypothetical protein
MVLVWEFCTIAHPMGSTNKPHGVRLDGKWGKRRNYFAGVLDPLAMCHSPLQTYEKASDPIGLAEDGTNL